MVAPICTWNRSLLENENKVQIHGNIELANLLKDIIKEKCIDYVDLYAAQEMIRDYCISKYGINFYEKNGEAISFIVENEYCNKERVEAPLFDMKSYIDDIRAGRVY